VKCIYYDAWGDVVGIVFVKVEIEVCIMEIRTGLG